MSSIDLYDKLEQDYKIPKEITERVIRKLVKKYDRFDEIKQEILIHYDEYAEEIENVGRNDTKLIHIVSEISEKYPYAFTSLGVYRDDILKDCIDILFVELWKNRDRISNVSTIYKPAVLITSYLKREKLVPVRKIPAGEKQDYWYVFISKE